MAYKKAKKNFYNNKQKNQKTSKTFLPLSFNIEHKLKQHIPNSIILTHNNIFTLKRTLKPPKQRNNIQQQCVYQIPCYNCPSVYIGETNDLSRRISQHKADLTDDNMNSALTTHRTNTHHKINLTNITTLKTINQVQSRKITESIYIYNTNNFNKSAGQFKPDKIQNSILLSSKYFTDLKNNKRPTN